MVSNFLHPYLFITSISSLLWSSWDCFQISLCKPDIQLHELLPSERSFWQMALRQSTGLSSTWVRGDLFCQSPLPLASEGRSPTCKIINAFHWAQVLGSPSDMLLHKAGTLVPSSHMAITSGWMLVPSQRLCSLQVAETMQCAALSLKQAPELQAAASGPHPRLLSILKPSNIWG